LTKFTISSNNCLFTRKFTKACLDKHKKIYSLIPNKKLTPLIDNLKKKRFWTKRKLDKI